MSTTLNGRTQHNHPGRASFVAPNGKRVYVRNADTATLFAYVAERWHNEVEKLPPATYNTYPNERRGYIVAHCSRPQSTTVGTGGRSVHTGGEGMDLLGDRHPYEATLRRRGVPYYDGFKQSQRDTIRAICREAKTDAGLQVLQSGLDFVRGYRDGMHVEISYKNFRRGVSTPPSQRIPFTDAEIRQAADRIRRRFGKQEFNPVGRTTRQVQVIVGVTPDGDYGPKTKAAVAQHQQYLTELGYQPGTADGLWGRGTNTAQEEYMSELTKLLADVRALAIVVNRIDKDGRIGVVHKDLADRIAGVRPASTDDIKAAVTAALSKANLSIDVASIAPEVEAAVKQAVGPYDLTLTRTDTKEN